MDVRAYETSDENSASLVLGRAFAEDPIFEYLLRDRRDRDARLVWCMRQGIRGAMTHGIGFVAAEQSRVLGVALWVRPGVRPTVSLAQNLLIGGWQAPMFLGIRGTWRELEREADLEERYARDLTEPHWVLDLLGVDPSQQGRGIGRALVEPMLARADDERVPAYLYTSKPDNVGYYRRFGFEVVSDRTRPGIPTNWSMRRLPR